ncbi:MAG: CBS domain-containing protein [Acidobacteriota bacterium]|nr:MAG: CBS domain-containing protein [Acidobacteriota bacterium]
MQTSEMMTPDVITVRAETTVEEIARLLTEHRINAVPVVDDEFHVIGMVSENELFLKEKGIPFSLVKLPALFRQWVDPGRLRQIYADSRHHTAADVMNRTVISVNVDDDIGQAATLMLKHKLTSLPVLRDGVLEGIVSRADILRLLTKSE